MRLPRLFRADRRDLVAQELYGAAVRQARLPAFYRQGEVPDTLDGRFDLVSLHVFLVMRRLTAEGAAGRDLAQRLYDVMFADMDRSLRELGVGDVGVGKRVKKMSEAYFGRVAAYHEALEAADDTALEAALRRNLYRGGGAGEDALGALGRYVRAAAAALGAQAIGADGPGMPAFPDPFPGPPEGFEP